MISLPHEKQIVEYQKTIDHLKKQNRENPIFDREIKKLEQKLAVLKKQIYSQLTPWERVLICRHSQRPHAIDYIENLFDSFIELSGDRLAGDDKALIGGLAELNGIRCVVIGQEKGKDTETRVERNFGMMNPEGFRKAKRLLKLAEKFHLPVFSFIDTPGAFPCLEAEERGQGWAIAENLQLMSRLATPIVVVVIGEGCSGGALGVGIGDVVAMLQHAYYSVIGPEGCASILWKDATKNVDAASTLKLNAENLLELGIIDTILPEPMEGAHQNPEIVYASVKQFLIEQWHTLKHVPTPLLIEQRYQKFRKMGAFVEKVHIDKERSTKSQ